jgi:hypothetical protein
MARIDPLRRWLYLACGVVVGLWIGVWVCVGEGWSTTAVAAFVAGLGMAGGVLSLYLGERFWEGMGGFLRWWTGLRDRGPL